MDEIETIVITKTMLSEALAEHMLLGRNPPTDGDFAMLAAFTHLLWASLAADAQ